MDLELGWRNTSDKVIACLIGMLALGAMGRVTWGSLVLFCGRGEPFVNELDDKRLYVCWKALNCSPVTLPIDGVGCFPRPVVFDANVFADWA